MSELAAALSSLRGRRLDAATVTPETGLVTLTLSSPVDVVRLVAGVGPRVVGVGFAPRTPVFSAGAKHPLVAALRAHAFGRAVRDVAHDDDQGLWITFGDDIPTARLRLFAALQGEARALDAAGELLVAWNGERLRPPRVCEPEGAPDDVGGELLRVSDALAAELRRGAIAKALRAHAKRLLRRQEAVEGDLARLDDVERLQRTGRLLLAQGNGIPRGATHATLDDWETGGTLDVTLDPARPAKQQAEGFFQQARRVQRGEAQMWRRLEETTRALAAVRALEAELDAEETATPVLLTRWMEAAKALGIREGEASPGRGRARQAPRLPYIEYAAWKGHRVLVGRGAADNDTLTLRVARPHDVWLHARGVAGAHVVVPLERCAQCPQELLLDAATLAAHHSDARGADFVEVTWTERRYVRKPRKSPAGSVVLDRERVLALRPERERLARLLTARRET